jgi:hypothetical protein
VVLSLTILAFLSLAPFVAAEPTALDTTFQSSFVYREAFLPPGLPSVALRTDETAMLWNPAGMAMSGAYGFGYAWKGTYYRDDKIISTHSLLMKAKGFGIGFIKDDYSEGVRSMTVFSLAPRVHPNIGLGWTSKWKGGWNFDAGAVLALGDHVLVSAVAKDIRAKEDARKYYEAGIAVFAMPKRLTLFFDFIDEDSSWRDESVYGGGIVARLQSSISVSVSYFTDESADYIWRASLRLLIPGRVIDGEYSVFSDDWETVSARIAYRSALRSRR